MTGAAIRSRLPRLRRDLGAARRGRELVERKRAVLLRELGRWRDRRDRLRLSAARGLDRARRALREAEIEMGRPAVDAAALAQPESSFVERRARSLVGIPLPRLRARAVPFRPRYAPGGTTASLDRAGAASAATLPGLVRLAEHELAVRNLERALERTARRVNALDKIIIPRLEREIREVGAALEEETRDEMFRHKRWTSARRPVTEVAAWNPVSSWSWR